ncbi:histone acetyltransferase Spt10 [Aspergillus sp. HF37]|nr:histone acetyltransferase Spt10 [Aspergillus sp. HF37]
MNPIHKILKTSTPLTLYPVTSPSSIPPSLLRFLHREFNAEVERGCTYPMDEKMSLDEFAAYWFGKFGVVAIAGPEDGLKALDRLGDDRDWETDCLGTFYVKPNYPGRCSHICNAGFLTTPAARGKGVALAMGEAYLEYAPKLGYKYSVFNLVFANNVPSIRTWEKLGFSVIGRIPGAGRLANSDELVDALVFGKSFSDSTATPAA